MELRSSQWYSGDARNAYIHRAWMRRGVPSDAFTGRPQIAIANTASDLTPCNAHLTTVAQSVKNGILEAGGVPLELPVVSLGETLVRPTAMLWRNMAAMATEEMLRANPIDGVVLLGGCDKTIPGAAHGSGIRRHPRRRRPGGSDAHRHLPRHGARMRHRCVAAQRGGARRHAERGRLPALRVGDDPQRRALQHDGHRVDDGARRGGARHDRARHRRNSRPGRTPARGRAADRPARRRPRRAGPHAQHLPHQGVVPQRDRRARRDRRVDERRRPPARDRRATGHRPHDRRLRPDRARRCRCW